MGVALHAAALTLLSVNRYATYVSGLEPCVEDV